MVTKPKNYILFICYLTSEIYLDNVINKNLFMVFPNEQSVRQWSGRLGSIPRRVIQKAQKWYLMLSYLTLSIIRYGSRVKWSNPGNRVAPPYTPVQQLPKRESSGHPRLRSPPLLFTFRVLYIINNLYFSVKYKNIYLFIIFIQFFCNIQSKNRKNWK